MGLADKLKPGQGIILTIVDEDGRLAAEQALAGSPAKSVATIDKKGKDGLKDALAEAGVSSAPIAPCCQWLTNPTEVWLDGRSISQSRIGS